MMASMDYRRLLFIAHCVLCLLCFAAPWFHQVGTVCALVSRACFHDSVYYELVVLRAMSMSFWYFSYRAFLLVGISV